MLEGTITSQDEEHRLQRKGLVGSTWATVQGSEPQFLSFLLTLADWPSLSGMLNQVWTEVSMEEIGEGERRERA